MINLTLLAELPKLNSTVELNQISSYISLETKIARGIAITRFEGRLGRLSEIDSLAQFAPSEAN